MTVTNQTRSIEYTGNAATTEFPFSFLASAASLGVKIYDTETETVTPVNSEDYSVVFVSASTFSTGTVTYPLVGDPLPITKKIIITRTVDLTQLLSLTNLQTFYAEDVMLALDRVVMMVQQISERANRSLAVREGEEPIEALVTSPAARANRALLFSEDGLQIEAGPTADAIAGAGAAATNAAESALASEASREEAAQIQEDLELLLAAGMAAFISFEPPSGMTAETVQEAIEETKTLYEAADTALAASVVAATPPGAVMPFARNTAPTGWLKADGSVVSRTTYAALFAAIGTTFGAGDGTTTFKLPDLRGEFVRAWDDGKGTDTGRTFGSSQAERADIPTNGYGTSGGILGTVTAGTLVVGSGNAENVENLESLRQAGASAVAASNVRPRNIALLYCIKT